jgi:hypothetical protein
MNMLETQSPQQHDSDNFDPSNGNPFVSQAGHIARERFIDETLKTDIQPATLESAGKDAQDISDAAAWDRAAHNVTIQSAVFEELHEGSKAAKKAARDLAVGTTVTAAALVVGSHVAGVGIDGFLDNQDKQNQQFQQQQQQWDQQQKQQQFEQGLDAGKVTINLSAPEQAPENPNAQTN